MFTGIVEGIGTVKAVRPAAAGAVISVDLAQLAQRVKPGDSIAINGVCLTVSGLRGNTAEFDVSAETLSKSTMDKAASGSAVNIERAMAADGRFGGHFVLGHVDGARKIRSIKKESKSLLWLEQVQLE